QLRQNLRRVGVGWPQAAQLKFCGLSNAPQSQQKTASGGFRWPQPEESGVISGATAGRWICDLRIGKAKTFMRVAPFLRFQSLSIFPLLYLSLRMESRLVH